MDLVSPGIGLIFWSVFIFTILLVVLGKFAWPPILNAVKSRNEKIREAIESAKLARKEMAELQASNEKILAEARKERDAILAEAKDLKDQIITEAKKKAEEEANKVVAAGIERLNAEKSAALDQVKKQVAFLSVDIAEKILRQKLEKSSEQEQLIESIINDTKFN